MQDHVDEDTAVDLKLYSHRWRRWLPQKQRNTDSNRASQEQEQEPDLEPDAFPGPMSAEDTDNSSHIEVGLDSCPIEKVSKRLGHFSKVIVTSAALII